MSEVEVSSEVGLSWLTIWRRIPLISSVLVALLLAYWAIIGLVMIKNRINGFQIVDVFFLKIRRPPRSTQSRSSAASDVYKRQGGPMSRFATIDKEKPMSAVLKVVGVGGGGCNAIESMIARGLSGVESVSYTHLRAHETVLDIVCRLLLEKKKRMSHMFIILLNQLIQSRVYFHTSHNCMQ